MAIAVVYRAPAMTAEQNTDRWEAGSPPPGLMFHAGVGEGRDFMTVTVWESQAADEAFAPVFARAMSERGVTFGSPQILPVHHVLTANGRAASQVPLRRPGVSADRMVESRMTTSFNSARAADSAERLTRTLIACTVAALAAAGSRAEAQDYQGKLTVAVYTADSQVTTDLNVRYSSHDWTGWIGWYGPQSEVRQSRAGIEYDFKRHGLVLVPSVQVASQSFVGGSVYSEIGQRVYLVAGVSRTNLKPYANLTFDPNESWQLGAGAHLGTSDSVAAFAIWDNRLDTGQQNSHLVIRHYLANARRLTVDLSYKSGHDDDGVYVRGTAEAMEYDWRRWFVKLARDQHVNYSGATMWRAGGGMRF